MPNFNPRAQEALTETKGFLHDLSITVVDKQETIAYSLGVTQETFSQWANPECPRNFPLALTHRLPREMALPLLFREISLVGPKRHDGLDGSSMDEIANMVVILGEIVELEKRGGNAAELSVLIHRLHEQEERIMAEKNGTTRKATALRGGARK